VFDVIKKYLYSNNYDNHNIPQYNFITDTNNIPITNISILKTETLTRDMINLGYSDFNNICKHKNTVVKDVNSYEKYLNSQSIRLINEFYKDDFLYFQYDMITPVV
jgi:hypothetical protein